MSTVGAAVLAVLFLGFPFYWGAWGHPGYMMPLAWAVLIAVLVNAKRLSHIDRTAASAFVFTLALSLVASTSAFMLGRFLTR